MRGTKLFVLVLLAVIVFWVGFMYIVSGGLTSWSIADTTKFRWMLGIILISITRLWWKLSDKHVRGNEVLLENWKFVDIRFWKPKVWIRKYNFRLRHCFELCGWMFGGVAIFGLGGGLFMQIMHYIVTAFAAVLVFLIVVRTETHLRRTLFTIGLLIAAAVWILGFLNIAFTVYFGEFLYIIPAIVWVFGQLPFVEEKAMQRKKVS